MLFDFNCKFIYKNTSPDGSTERAVGVEKVDWKEPIAVFCVECKPKYEKIQKKAKCNEWKWCCFFSWLFVFTFFAIVQSFAN